MTILLLDQFSELGGGQLCLLDLVPGLLDRGWQVRAALPGDGELVHRLGALGVPVDKIRCGPYHSGHKTPADAARFLADMLSTARRLSSADLIYVNGPRLLPAVAAARLDSAVLFHIHSCLDKAYAARLAEWSVRLTGATVISSSRYAARCLHTNSIRFVDNGVADCRRPRKEYSGPKRIGVVGRIAPEKGQVEFIRAARLLADTGADCRFIVCGAPAFSEPAYAAYVEREARGFPVEYTGWSNDVPAVLAGLDLLVVPSTGSEATPRVIPEAFSAGVPVVASAIGGIPELIEDGVTGFLTPPGSPGQLAATLQRVLALDLDAVRTNARACWEQRFTLQRYRDGVCSAIVDCLRSSSVAKRTAAASAISAPMLRGKE